MYISEFLNYLKHEKRYSVHTLIAYETDLNQFHDFLVQEDVSDLLTVKTQQIRSFMVQQMESGISANAMSRKISTLRSFYNYLQRGGLINHQPMTLIRAPKVPKKLPVFIDDQKMDQLLDSTTIFGEGFPAKRDKLILELLFGTGIRLSELLQLVDNDIDPYQGTLKVLGKRQKQRIVPLHHALVKEIEDYVETKKVQKFNNKSQALIVNDHGEAANRGMIYRIVKHYLGFVSTQQKRSPHVLRHSFASSLLNRGADLNAIKELLGHAGLAATQVYTHTSVERLKTIYKQAHPKA